MLFSFGQFLQYEVKLLAMAQIFSPVSRGNHIPIDKAGFEWVGFVDDGTKHKICQIEEVSLRKAVSYSVQRVETAR